MYNPQVPIHGADSIAAPTGGNSSGMGGASAVPPELRGWNWGAFLLSLIWGIGNNTWIALLTLVPIVNWVMPFVLGAKGNAWAWRNKRWRDIAHFRRVQRRWAIAGVVWWVVWLLVMGAVAVAPWALRDAMARHPISELAFGAVQTSPEAVTLLGSPIQRLDGAQSIVSGQHPGEPSLVRFMISGPRGNAVVEARGRQAKAGWVLEQVLVKPAEGGVPLMVLPRQRL